MQAVHESVTLVTQMTLKTWHILVTHKLESLKRVTSADLDAQRKGKHSIEIEETISQAEKRLNLGRNLFFQ